MAKKQIEMYLEQGTLEGIVQCTLSGWFGSAYRVPRTMLAEANKNPELSKSGVYCLLNEETGKAYVGQGAKRRDDTGVLKRVSRHDIATEGYWDTAIIFIAQNKDLSRTEISYLEHQFYKLAKAAGRFDLQNGQLPPDGTPGRGVVCDMDYFIGGARLVMQALGHMLFEPQKKDASSGSQASLPSHRPEIHTLTRFVAKTWQVEARGWFTSDGKFVVLKGSTLAPMRANRSSVSEALKKLRSEHCLPDTLTTLQVDMEFGSPSTAAAFVIGNNVNGHKEWKK